MKLLVLELNIFLEETKLFLFIFTFLLGEVWWEEVGCLKELDECAVDEEDDEDDEDVKDDEGVEAALEEDCLDFSTDDFLQLNFNGRAVQNREFTYSMGIMPLPAIFASAPLKMRTNAAGTSGKCRISLFLGGLSRRINNKFISYGFYGLLCNLLKSRPSMAGDIFLLKHKGNNRSDKFLRRVHICM